MPKYIALQDFIVPGYPKFFNGKEYLLDEKLAQSLISRGQLKAVEDQKVVKEEESDSKQKKSSKPKTK